MCWLDDQHVAIWNIELWDQEEFDLKPEPKNRSGIHLLSLAKTMWGDDYSANYWEMPEQTQQVFNLYADQNLLIIVGNQNITTYAIADRIFVKSNRQFTSTKSDIKVDKAYCLLQIKPFMKQAISKFWQ